jgi:hypothetical protein
MYLNAAHTSFIMQVVFLSFAVLFASCPAIQTVVQQNHSLLLCKDVAGNRTDYCFTVADCFNDTGTGPLQQKVRGCTEDEPYFRLSYLFLFMVTGMLSLKAIAHLHRLADYRNMFKATKEAKTPIIHRSLIIQAVKEKDTEFLKEVLEATEDKAAVLERPDRTGD